MSTHVLDAEAASILWVTSRGPSRAAFLHKLPALPADTGAGVQGERYILMHQKDTLAALATSGRVPNNVTSRPGARL